MRLYNDKGDWIAELTLQDLELLQNLTDNKMFHMRPGDKMEMTSVAFKEIFDNVHDEILKGMKTKPYLGCVYAHRACIALYTVIEAMVTSKTGIYEIITWKAPTK